MQDIKLKSQNILSSEPPIKKRRFRFFRFALISLYIMVLGAFGAVLADRAIFPYLAEMKIFNKYAFLKRTVERTTIINKTEQVVMPADFANSKVFEDNKLSPVKILEKKSNENSSAGNFEAFFANGFAVTQDGIIFGGGDAAAFAALASPQKFSIVFGGGGIKEFELAKESDSDISIFKCSGGQCSNDRLDINVLPFEEDVKIGEEISIISQDSMLIAFVKSKTSDKIFLNDYPDTSLDGSIALNKKGKITGMYRVKKENGVLISYLVSATALEQKAEEIFKK